MFNNEQVRIAGIALESVVDGPGIRSTIFFQGCPHHCQGCHNPETWDPAGGRPVTLAELLPMLKLNPLVNGVTFSGGEPFLQAVPLAKFGSFLKQHGLSLWVYTGYTWEFLVENKTEPGFQDLLEVTDVLIDGPFQMATKTPGLAYRGSANQRLINVKESLSLRKVVAWQLESPGISRQWVG